MTPVDSIHQCWTCTNVVCLQCGAVDDLLHKAILLDHCETTHPSLACDFAKSKKAKDKDELAEHLSLLQGLGRNCSEFAIDFIDTLGQELGLEHQGAASMVRLVQRAVGWASEHWTPDMPRIVSVVPNPGVAANCPSVKRFLQAAQVCRFGSA